ncbi:alpha/beta hydrolase [Pseudooceanicola sediminis]|uniref:Alpha/beta hydrolase n=1 Tax=Pseudooceanicola sediminis TaxID=2211117 RepID=A0A399J294_9RHOB|nr:alpha/beta hydrolase [Pseudooceanicola sediminis]KAA2314705.1 alpha/beta hydrolase [Puniceibacterium sp. HSS470]RII39341.1 alpha/beta hydrolase [Pseudooceanicola sediminis]|tara:strand:+ start:191294 stop:192016 length:723 start_codon:yes stop_codon:yes gene_type:complete
MTTLLLIPGLVSDARVWKCLRDQATDGTTFHDADVTRDATIPAMAARLLHEVSGPFIAVGHSLGGRVAMEIAHQAPERVQALVLANTGHNARTPGEDAKRQAKIDLGHRDMQALAADWLPGMLDPARTGDIALVSDLTEMVLAAGADVHERQIRALLARPDAATYLPDITCPVLLLTGAQDLWSPVAQHQVIADLLPQSELRVIDNAGHFMPVERPDETAALVLDWLSRQGLATATPQEA